MTSAGFKIANIKPFGNFYETPDKPGLLFTIPKRSFGKTNSSAILPATLVCKMAIFALLGVFPFSYLPLVFEENNN